MAVSRWGEFGQAVVRTITEARAGEDFVVVADTWSDLEAAEAVLIAAVNAKTRAQLLIIPRILPGDTAELSTATVAGLAEADVIVGLCESIDRVQMRDALTMARQKGARVAQTPLRGVEDWAIEGLVGIDYAAMIERAKRIAGLFKDTNVCRVTSDAGTDISFRLGDRPCLLGDGRAIQPGQIGYFPGATPSVAPIEETVDGTIVVDGAASLGIGLVSSPITLVVENGAITRVDGGSEARVYRAALEAAGDPNAYNVVHFNVGINPRARMQSDIHQDEQVMGAVTFGFGHQDPSFQGAAGPARIHSDVVLRSPTVLLDETVLCEHNRLNPQLDL